MKSLAAKPQNDAPSRQRLWAPDPLARFPVNAMDHVARLQRKPACPCGGGCPRCEATRSGFGALHATEPSGAANHHESGAVSSTVSRFESTPPAGQQQIGEVAVEEAPPVLAPTPAATTYPGCTAEQNTKVESARTTARSRANSAASAMTALKGGTGTKAQQAALTAHFGALTAAQFDTAKDRYATISTRLGNPALFACGSAPAQSYCGPPDNWCAGTVCPTTTGISYLCPNAFGTNCAEPNLWSIMLHESARAAGCCPPDVMSSDAGYPPAAPACLTNVYSYSGFARAI